MNAPKQDAAVTQRPLTVGEHVRVHDNRWTPNGWAPCVSDAVVVDPCVTKEPYTGDVEVQIERELGSSFYDRASVETLDQIAAAVPPVTDQQDAAVTQADMIAVPRDLLASACHCVRKHAGVGSETYRQLSVLSLAPALASPAVGEGLAHPRVLATHLLHHVARDATYASEHDREQLWGAFYEVLQNAATPPTASREDAGAGLPEVLPGHWDTPAGREMALRSLTETRKEAGGELSDMALANEAYLSPGIINLQRAKERMRWLSAQLAVALATPPAASSQPSAGEVFTRITRDEYPEIIQAARWMDDDHGTPHFEPGIGFIVDDPEGLSVPVRWLPHLTTIEAALAGLDHANPHPLDVDTIACLAREGKEPGLHDSAVYCFISGEHTPVTAMAQSSAELWTAHSFFNERFEGWQFDPATGWEKPAAPPTASQPSACGAAPDHADIMETIENASNDWQKQSYTSALAEVRDMANVGRALMEALPDGYSYMNCPSEIVSDLQNERDDARAALPASDGLREAIRAEIINTPETADFMAGVPLEAAHQRERWGASHDGGKTPFDWFWLIGYLAQKAASAQVAGDDTKALHHTISTAAALANWHAQIAGRTDMRPGIGPDDDGEKPGSAFDLATALGSAS